MSDQAFFDQIEKTLSFEGGYVWNKDDPGGETNFGISKEAYPHIDIRQLTKEQAIEIYYRDYWQEPKCGMLPPDIAAKIFDLGVNMGPRAAIKILQRSINELLLLDHIQVDGRIGPITAAAAQVPQAFDLLTVIRRKAVEQYEQIVKANPRMAVFIHGWRRRAMA